MVDEIPYDDIRIAWHSNSYDGCPLTGHAWWKGLYCYFSGGFWERVRNPDNPGEWREEAHWTLYELTGEALLTELAARKLFEDMVGYHCTRLPDLDEKGQQPRYGFTGGFTENWKAYYDDPRWTPITKRKLDVATLPKLGTFAQYGKWSTEPFEDDDAD